jgi:hypothetical protein
MVGALTYCAVGSNRLEDAKRFYDALLGLAGLAPAFEHPSGGRVYGRDGRFCFAVLDVRVQLRCARGGRCIPR